MKPENQSYYSPEREVVKEDVINGRDINRCIGCGIQDARIECGGIWHCPNPLCRAAGAWAAREAFGFQQKDTQDSEGIMPTEEFVALRGWALRMVEAATDKEQNKKDMNLGRS